MLALKTILFEVSTLTKQKKLDQVFSLSAKLVDIIQDSDTNVLNECFDEILSLFENICHVKNHSETINLGNFNEFISTIIIQLKQKNIQPEKLAIIPLNYQATFYLLTENLETGISILRENIQLFEKEIAANYALKIETYELLIRLYVMQRNAQIHLNAIKEFEPKFQDTTNEQAFYLSKWGDYYLFSDLKKAINFYTKARNKLEINSETDKKILIRIYERTAIAHYNLEDYFIAESYFMISVLLLKDINEIRAITLMNIGNCSFLNNQKAIFYYKKAEQKEIKNYGLSSANLVHIYRNLAGYYLISQSYKETIKYADKALAIKEKNTTLGSKKIKVTKAAALNALGNHNEAIGLLSSELVEAEDNYEPIFVLFKTTLAISYANLNNFETAFENINKSFRFLQPDYNASDLQLSNPDLYKVENKKDLYDTFEAKTEILYLLFKQNTNNFEALYACIFTLQLYLLTTDLVLKSLKNRKSKVLENQDLRENYSKYIAILGELETVISKNTTAFQAAKKSVINNNKTIYPPQKFNYANDVADIKAILFELIEKDKSAVLLELLTEVNSQKLPEKINKTDKKFNRKINTILKDVELDEAIFFATQYNSASEEEIAFKKLINSRAKYINAWEAFEAFKNQHAKHYLNPQQKTDNYSENIYDYNKLQKALQKDQAILNYFIHQQELYIHFLSKKECIYKKIIVPQNLKETLSAFNQSINQFDENAQFEHANELSKYLILPITNLLETQEIQHLFVIPHSYLNNLAFESLFYEAADEDEFFLFGGTFPYLIEKYSVSYHFSASLLYHSLKNQTSSTTESYLGFAPVYTNIQQTNNLDVEDPNPKTYTEAVRSVKIGDNEYQALLHSEQEIKKVQNLFEKNGKQTTTFLHKNATIEKFTQTVEQHQIIHIAAHGYETDKGIDLSGIIFSPNENDSEKSIFYLQDAYNLKLNANLVVLSCCKSGIGEYLQGEGVMAINRGFIQAGAANVLFTLFKIYDNSSSEFIQYFFEQVLNNKHSYNKALQLSKQYFIKSEKFNAPKHWAGFVLIGS